MRSYDAMEQYWIWLSSVPGIGVKKFYRLIGLYEDARTVWDNVGDAGMKFLGAKALEELRKARDEKYFISLFSRMEQLGIEAYGVSSDYHTYYGQFTRDCREILARVKDCIYCIFKPEPTFLGDAIPIFGNGNATNDGTVDFS